MGFNTQNIADIKVVRMIPGPRHATAAGVSASAPTYGSGGASHGVVDTAGYDQALLMVLKSAATAAKVSWKFYHQSGATTLAASANSIASAVACGITASRVGHMYRLNLTGYKRYLNAKITTCTTCGMTQVLCILTKGEVIPPGNNGFTVTRNLANA